MRKDLSLAQLQNIIQAAIRTPSAEQWATGTTLTTCPSTRPAPPSGNCWPPSATPWHTYGFGDDRERGITVEKVLPADESAPAVRCTSGCGQGPAADCGGVRGWSSVVKAVNDPAHQEYRDWLEMEAGDALELGEFDKDELNEDLIHLFRPTAACVVSPSSTPVLEFLSWLDFRLASLRFGDAHDGVAAETNLDRRNRPVGGAVEFSGTESSGAGGKASLDQSASTSCPPRTADWATSPPRSGHAARIACAQACVRAFHWKITWVELPDSNNHSPVRSARTTACRVRKAVA